MSSANGIIRQSASKRRYTNMDLLLQAFVSMPGSTAKEVAVKKLHWDAERYSSAPKRAADLVSDRLGYLEMCGDRECSVTGAVAHTYRVTQRGIAHLRKQGLHVDVVARVKVDKPVSNAAVGRSALASLRSALDQ